MELERDEWETLTTFIHSYEASLVAGRLESDGIEAQLLDMGVVGMLPDYSLPMGGIRLQVRRSDMERARDCLAANIVETLCVEEVGYVEDDDPDDSDLHAPAPDDSAADKLAARAFRAAILGPFCRSSEPSGLFGYRVSSDPRSFVSAFSRSVRDGAHP